MLPIYEWLDFLVFSVGTVSSLSQHCLVPINLWDVKEPTHCSKKVRDIVPSVVTSLSLSLISSVVHIRAWVGWVGEVKIWTDSGCQWHL